MTCFPNQTCFYTNQLLFHFQYYSFLLILASSSFSSFCATSDELILRQNLGVFLLSFSSHLSILILEKVDCPSPYFGSLQVEFSIYCLQLVHILLTCMCCFLLENHLGFYPSVLSSDFGQHEIFSFPQTYLFHSLSFTFGTVRSLGTSEILFCLNLCQQNEI